MTKNANASARIPRPTGDIARRAHELYVERGRADGFDREDWLCAERELTTAPPVTTGKASATRTLTTKERPL
jgi:hypothetical protein